MGSYSSDHVLKTDYVLKKETGLGRGCISILLDSYGRLADFVVSES